jgi:hypothetical protein
MTYSTGGSIQATDYNTFATLTGGINEVFGDMHSGATTIGAFADFGYGQTSTLTSVSAGNAIHASEWDALFTAMKNCGTHQGTTVVPPLPSSNPNVGDAIAAFNSPTAFSTIITNLRNNRKNVAVGQSTLIVGSNFTQPIAVQPWVNTLTFAYQVDFGSWDNARYFFNAGGYLGLNGSYSPSTTPDDAVWVSMLTAMSPLVFNWTSTTPNSGTGGTAIGFYQLTTTYQTIYNHTYGVAGSYSNNSIQVQAKYDTTAGTNGKVDFTITLTDLDPTARPNKAGTTVYHIDTSKASGAITYPGTVSIASVGANSGFSKT